MKRTLLALGLLLALSACDKYGVNGSVNQTFGNWAEVHIPAGCVPVQIAAEHESGVVVLCRDGRIFH